MCASADNGFVVSVCVCVALIIVTARRCHYYHLSTLFAGIQADA